MRGSPESYLSTDSLRSWGVIPGIWGRQSTQDQTDARRSGYPGLGSDDGHGDGDFLCRVMLALLPEIRVLDGVEPQCQAPIPGPLTAFSSKRASGVPFGW